MKHPLQQAEFLLTAASDEQLPPPGEPEIAFAGRSNAGKSSAINALAQRKRMAFVSKTPGRTQHINFFRVGPDRYLVDLPGYGYAAVPPPARAHWHELVGGYLQSRSSLRGVIVVMDSRHPLTPLDQQLLAWLTPTGVPIHVLLSKSDKLGAQSAGSTLRDVDTALRAQYSNCSVQLFSSTRKLGVADAAKQIQRWLGDSMK